MKIIHFLIIASIGILAGCGVIDENEGVIKIKNSTSSNTDIRDIYIKRSNANNWGNNKLNAEELEPGESKKYTIDKCDRNYDFKIVYINDNIAYEEDYYIGCYSKRTLLFRD